MTKREMITEALRNLGYKPDIDDDGDVFVRYQMKIICFLIGQEDEQYVSALFSQFHSVEDGKETLALAACNKVSREMKVAKVYIDRTLKNVSAAYGFYYTDMKSLERNVEMSLGILGIVRSRYHEAEAELSGD